MPKSRPAAAVRKPSATKVIETLDADGRFVVDTFQDSGLISRTLWMRAEAHNYSGHVRLLADAEEGFELYVFTMNYTVKWSARFDASTPAPVVLAAFESAILG